MAFLNAAVWSDARAASRKPVYARENLEAGIVHIGVGNFHRAHLAEYVDDLLSRGDRRWAICGGGVRAQDARMRERLIAQDTLYTLTLLDPAGPRCSAIGAIVDFAPVEEGHGALIEKMAARETAIVSLTVTEGGYFLDAATGSVDPNAPELAADRAEPARPTTAFGAIVEALARRRAAGLPGLTVMSCDNIQHNGDVARQAVLAAAGDREEGLRAWIERDCAFPCAMVDRIAPATSEASFAHAPSLLGFEDAAPVTGEPYKEWALEDRFANDRPAFDAVGAHLVADVEPYERMKIRLLNGGHALLAAPAALLGHVYAHQAMADPTIAGFMRAVLEREIAPSVGATATATPEAYIASISARFANPAIADQIERLCQDSSNRRPKFLHPSAREALARGGSIDGLALSEAIWRRYCRGVSENGAPIALDDPRGERLNAAARDDDPRAWLAMDDVYGDLGATPAFENAFVAAASALEAHGVAGAIADYLAR